MKKILLILLLTSSKAFSQDTLTNSRFIEDSFGNGYEIEYRYTDGIEDKFTHAELKDAHEKKLNLYYEEHRHYIALVKIIAFRGNKTKIIAQNIKAIYSPVECVSDSRELWLKRLYQILNNKNK